MTNVKEEFIKKYTEFVDFINQTNVDELTAGMKAVEVEAFRKQLNTIDTPNIQSKLQKKAQELFKDEHPILKVAHHYPELNKFNFLTETQIKNLDQHLKYFKVDEPIFNFHRVALNANTVSRIKQELIEVEIVEERYALACPHCIDSNLSGYVNANKKSEMITLFEEYKTSHNYDIAEKFLADLDGCCSRCIEEFDIDQVEDVDSLQWRKNLVLIKEQSDFPKL